MSPALRVSAALLAAFASLARAEAPDGGTDGGRARSDLRTISGTVAAVDAAARTLTVQGPDGLAALELDRNTVVFLDSHLGTVRDLWVGAPVRASYGGDRRAFWVELRARSDGGSAPGGAASRETAGGRGGTDGGPPVLVMPPAADGGRGDAGRGDGGPVAPSTEGGFDGGSAAPAGGGPTAPGQPGGTGGRTAPPPSPGPAGPGPVPGGVPPGRGPGSPLQ